MRILELVLSTKMADFIDNTLVIIITHVLNGITCYVQLLRPFDQTHRNWSQQIPTMLCYNNYVSLIIP